MEAVLESIIKLQLQIWDFIDTLKDHQIFWEEYTEEAGDICGWNCDIVMYSSIGERLKRTIHENRFRMAGIEKGV